MAPKSSPARWVLSKKVAATDLYCETPWWKRYYVAPFAVLYVVWMVGGIRLHGTSKAPGWLIHKEFYLIPLFLIASAHFIMFMSRFWSVKADAWLSYRRVSGLDEAEKILVVPAEHCGKSSLCKLERCGDRLYFLFQQQKFIHHAEKNIFEKLRYPNAEALSVYKASNGLDQDSVRSGMAYYDSNEFKIPVPTFSELWKEHAVAPFFIFQVFCVGLWLLDDYWYYSLFTLFMLCVFESTVVYQRLRNIKDFQTMSIPVMGVHVKRDNRWISITSNQLLPGDLCCIASDPEGEMAVPCDLVLLASSAIVNEAMLSGESTPLLKESIYELGHDDEVVLDVKDEHRNNVLFGGTKIMQITPSDTLSNYDPPVSHCLVGFVIHTGFATTQGKLVRTMMFSSERMTANNVESFLFILFLMVFAIGAAVYVLIEGSKDESRSRYKLLLECILIITAVVPPELPMELSMAVNNSLMALSQFAIFVMEPFRIPYAGKIDICCFDKTGTLTGENLQVEGVVFPGEPLQTDCRTLPQDSALCMASCHSLFRVKDAVSGDSMEKAMIEFAAWTVEAGDVMRTEDGSRSLTVLHRFAFSSALKRMSVVVSLRSGASAQCKLYVKGAPEIIKDRLRNVPADYDQVFERYALSGARILSLACKSLSPNLNHERARNLDRDAVERDLDFAGFIVFRCPLKPDSKKAVRSLKNSGHKIVIITGDNSLTAIHTGKELEIVGRSVAHGDMLEEGLVFTDNSGNVVSFESLLQDRFDMCLTGDAFDHLKAGGQLEVLKRCSIFARASPSQKEGILAFYKQLGFITLMCGDGTNDVGALKQAHVGVALLDGKPEDLPTILFEMRQQSIKRQKAELEASAKALRQKIDKLNTSAGRQPLPEGKKTEETLMSLNEALQGGEQEGPTFRLGDASVAAPFSSRISTIEAVCNIIRQGRCTLVTTIQMYKILAINSLISAYSLSVLHLQGIRYGDFQVTITGLLLAGCFLFLTKAHPIKRLTADRPQSNIFNAYLLVSVMGQFVLHISTLFYIVSASKRFVFARAIDEKNPFEPGLVNTAVYLLSLLMQVSTFVVNYQGRPFRESLVENKPLRNSLLIVSFISCLAASEAVPEFNEWIQLVPMPASFRRKLCLTMALDFFGCLSIEAVSRKFLFSK